MDYLDTTFLHSCGYVFSPLGLTDFELYCYRKIREELARLNKPRGNADG